MSPRFGALPGTSTHAAAPTGRPAAVRLADRAGDAFPRAPLPDFRDLARSFERTVP